MTHLPPTTNPNATRVGDDHTIVVPPEDRCLVVPPDDHAFIQPPDITKIERSSGRSRLARGLEALLEAHERRPDGLRKMRRSVVNALFPAEAERITAILEGQRKPQHAERSERTTAKQAAAILGVKSRKLQAMSQRGEIPGAAKLGRQWTYDLAKLRGFVEQREQACQNEKPRLGATGAAEFYGAKFRLKASASGGRLRQMIQQSQKRVAKLAKREQ